jgi:hypothetical protein
MRGDAAEGPVPVFKSRRGAEALPVLRPAQGPKGFGFRIWFAGFVCGLAAAVVGMSIAVILMRGLA